MGLSELREKVGIDLGRTQHRRLLMVGVDPLRVEAGGRSDFGMPELRRDVTQRDVAGEELASVGISQILESPAANVRALQDVLPLSPAKLGCPDFDGGRKLDFAAIIVRGGRYGTEGLPAGVSASRRCPSRLPRSCLRSTSRRSPRCSFEGPARVIAARLSQPGFQGHAIASRPPHAVCSAVQRRASLSRCRATKAGGDYQRRLRQRCSA